MENPGRRKRRYLGMVGLAAFLVLAAAGTRSLSASECQEGKPCSSFDQLPEADRNLVRSQYDALLAAHEKRDFAAMRESAESILRHLNDYRDTKAYLAIAKRGLETLEEKKQADRQRVGELEAKGEALFQKSKADPKALADLEIVMQEILVKSPGNEKVKAWQEKLKASPAPSR